MLKIPPTPLKRGIATAIQKAIKIKEVFMNKTKTFTYIVSNPPFKGGGGDFVRTNIHSIDHLSLI
ncbi:MAG: hypothetical protein ORN58_07480 [Sediminibacterium sp.]|nr:hypothetical protein [Sediminibacterium sp.]